MLIKSSVNKKGIVWLVSIYAITLYWFSIFTRATESEFLIRPLPFWSYAEAFQTSNWYLFVQNGLNILLFLPFGFLLYSIFPSKKKCLYIGMIYCLLIECSQLLFRKGYFDIDDIMHNGLGILFGVLILEWIYKKMMNNKINVSNYDFSNTENPTINMAMLSDLHEFKSDLILEKLRELKPDVILLVGDILERREGQKHQKREEFKGNWYLYRFAWFIDDCLEFFFGKQDRKSEYAFEFLIEAKKIAPVIYSRGNHERDMTESDFEFLRQHEIPLLDNKDSLFTIHGRTIRIGGLSTHIDELWLESFSKKEGRKILMMHHPEYYDELYCCKEFDLVLSGHAHGGQIRIGQIGLFSPGQGIFPKYTKGIYNQNLVVSAGCSNTSYIPRLGNPKEILMIKF